MGYLQVRHDGIFVWNDRPSKVNSHSTHSHGLYTALKHVSYTPSLQVIIESDTMLFSESRGKILTQLGITNHTLLVLEEESRASSGHAEVQKKTSYAFIKGLYKRIDELYQQIIKSNHARAVVVGEEWSFLYEINDFCTNPRSKMVYYLAADT